MDIPINTQTIIFLYSILFGFVISVIYDFFKAFRRYFKYKTLGILVNDFLFWFITILCFIIFMLNFCSGQGRFYIIFAIILGIVFYFLTLTQLFYQIFIFIAKTIHKIHNIFCKQYKKLKYYPFIKYKKNKKISKKDF